MASITINYTQSEIAALITADVRAKWFEPRNVNFDVTASEPHTLSATCRAELRQKSHDSSGNFKDY